MNRVLLVAASLLLLAIHAGSFKRREDKISTLPSEPKDDNIVPLNADTEEEKMNHEHEEEEMNHEHEEEEIKHEHEECTKLESGVSETPEIEDENIENETTDDRDEEVSISESDEDEIQESLVVSTPEQTKDCQPLFPAFASLLKKNPRKALAWLKKNPRKALALTAATGHFVGPIVAAFHVPAVASAFVGEIAFTLRGCMLSWAQDNLTGKERSIWERLLENIVDTEQVSKEVVNGLSDACPALMDATDSEGVALKEGLTELTGQGAQWGIADLARYLFRRQRNKNDQLQDEKP